MPYSPCGSGHQYTSAFPDRSAEEICGSSSTMLSANPSSKLCNNRDIPGLSEIALRPLTRIVVTVIVGKSSSAPLSGARALSALAPDPAFCVEEALCSASAGDQPVSADHASWISPAIPVA
ncbi:MAG: hypothetical protein NZ533_11995 [Casimicrobiaceae bacterium]|nr:hypothetical protein [Casimicrobiaceae bacterium]